MTTPTTPTTDTAEQAELLELRQQLARMRAERDQLGAELIELRVEAQMRQMIRTQFGRLDDTEADTVPVPPRFTTALRFGVRDATVTVQAGGREVCIVLAQVSNRLDRGREAFVWQQVEAVIDEVATHPAAAADLLRMSLPDEVGAITWRQDGHPVVVISTATRHPALRQALRIAGHDVVGSATHG